MGDGDGGLLADGAVGHGGVAAGDGVDDGGVAGEGLLGLLGGGGDDGGLGGGWDRVGGQGDDGGAGWAVLLGLLGFDLEVVFARKRVLFRSERLLTVTVGAQLVMVTSSVW